MQGKQDYYTMLGVPPNAAEEEIRRAFRLRAKALHPDSQAAGGHIDSDYDFGSLTAAYETLRDADRREAYDRNLVKGRQLASRRGNQRKLPRAFAGGLAIGFLAAAAVIGTKIYLDLGTTRTEAKWKSATRAGE